MSDNTENTNTENTKTENSDLPNFDVFHVPEGKRVYWTKIGAGWMHKDAQGLTIELNLMPYNNSGRIVLRKPDLKKEKEAEPEI